MRLPQYCDETAAWQGAAVARHPLPPPAPNKHRCNYVLDYYRYTFYIIFMVGNLKGTCRVV